MNEDTLTEYRDDAEVQDVIEEIVDSLEELQKTVVDLEDSVASKKDLDSLEKRVLTSLREKFTELEKKEPKIETRIEYKKPTDAELRVLIRGLIPKVKDGETPTKADLEALIRPLIPKVSAPTLADVVEELKPDIMKLVPRGGGNMNRNIRVNGVEILTGYTDINLKNGSNVTLSASTNNTTKYTDITITSTGGGGGSGYQAATGTVNGSNTTFSFATEPTAISVDGQTLQKTASDGTVNWTGTTTITLAVAPTRDIFGFATSSSGYQAATGTVNGSNTVFDFTSAPQAIVVDGQLLQKTASDSTVNWTGTTTITLLVAPTRDIFAVA